VLAARREQIVQLVTEPPMADGWRSMLVAHCHLGDGGRPTRTHLMIALSPSAMVVSKHGQCRTRRSGRSTRVSSHREEGSKSTAVRGGRVGSGPPPPPGQARAQTSDASWKQSRKLLRSDSACIACASRSSASCVVPPRITPDAVSSAPTHGCQAYSRGCRGRRRARACRLSSMLVSRGY
jgi:hypothetical protein